MKRCLKGRCTLYCVLVKLISMYALKEKMVNHGWLIVKFPVLPIRNTIKISLCYMALFLFTLPPGFPNIVFPIIIFRVVMFLRKT